MIVMPSTGIGGATALGVAALLYLAVPEPAFLTVVSLEVKGARVEVERIIQEPRVIADWRVTVVGAGEDAPLCSTIPGPLLDQGWSIYEPSRSYLRDMHLDEWVGDPGCYDRLQSGPHEMFITWTPRDGSQIVFARYEFNVWKPS